MVTITEKHIRQLIQIEAAVHYYTPPPLNRNPFVTVKRNSPVLLSAPHGAITVRKSPKKFFHREDQYTAGIALLIGKLCHTSVIANIWLTPDSDPNYHFEDHSRYKQEVRQLVQESGIKWVIDLHGVQKNSPRIGKNQLVDLGTRKGKRSLRPELVDFLKRRINQRLLGEDFVQENGYPAYETRDFISMTAFCHQMLRIEAVQIEMKPQVRIPLRRAEGKNGGRASTPKGEIAPVLGMMQALADFVEYLHQLTEECIG